MFDRSGFHPAGSDYASGWDAGWDAGYAQGQLAAVDAQAGEREVLMNVVNAANEVARAESDSSPGNEAHRGRAYKVLCITLNAFDKFRARKELSNG